MKTIWGAVLLAMMMLATAALAADLDTPKVGAAVCAPEEENGSVVLHEAPDGRSETLMRYFQGAPLQVLDLADGWAHVRMGMTGESLEGYIRQERLKYGAEAMREVQQYAEMPAFDEDTPVYEACDEQSGVIDILAAPGAVKIMGYNGQWVAVWGENGFIPMTWTIRPQRWTSSWMVLPLAGEITRDDAMRKLREWVPQKREEWNISEVYTDARVLDEEMRWDCSGLFYEPLTGETFYHVYMNDPILMDGRKWSMDILIVEMSAKGEVMNVYNTLPQTGVAVCAPVEESDTVTLYAEPDESSDMLFHYYSGMVAEVLEVQRAWIRVRIGQGEAALEGWMPARLDLRRMAGARCGARRSVVHRRGGRTGGLRCAGRKREGAAPNAAERNCGSERNRHGRLGAAELVRQRACNGFYAAWRRCGIGQADAGGGVSCQSAGR